MHEIAWLVTNFLLCAFFFVAGVIVLGIAVASLKRQLGELRTVVQATVREAGGIRRELEKLEKTLRQQMPVPQVPSDATGSAVQSGPVEADQRAPVSETPAAGHPASEPPPIGVPRARPSSSVESKTVVQAELVAARASEGQQPQEPAGHPAAAHTGATRHEAERPPTGAFGGQPPRGSGATATDSGPGPERRAREASEFEQAAWEILRRCWNWLIVGEEYRRKDVTIEFAVASTWLLRLGVLVSLFGVGFFLKYSVERDLIGPLGRVVLTVASGLACMALGARLLGTKYGLLGHGLLGIGIACEYFATFAACNFYELIGVRLAFVLMLGVTALAGTIAVLFDALHIAVLGVAGGYLTPVLLSTGEPAFAGLFVYLTALGAGILGIGYYKRWHVLLWLALFANYAIEFLAIQGRYRPEFFWQVLPFLCVLFVLFSTSVFLFNVVHGAASTLLELLALTFNALMFFYLGFGVIEAAYGRTWVGALTAALAVFYTLHCYAFLRAQEPDRGLVATFLALASFFVAVTIPLVLAETWVTAAWAVQALIMLWLSERLRSQFLQRLAILVYGLVTVRLLVTDLRVHFYAPVAVPRGGGFWQAFVERLVAFGIPVGCFGLAARVLPPKPARAVSDKTWDESRGVAWAGPVLLVLSLALAVAYLHHELNFMFGILFPPLRLPMLTALWAALAAGLLLVYLRRPADWLLFAAVVVLAVVVAKLILWDIPSWELTGWVYAGAYDPVEALARLVDFAAVLGLSVYGYVSLRRAASASDQAVQLQRIFAVVGTVLLFVYLTLETNTFLNAFLPAMRQGGITILWTLFGLGLLAVGLVRRITAARLSGLGLFAVVAWKVFFVDLRHLQQLYRVIAFLVLGVLTLLGAFLYLKFDVLFRSTSRDVSGEAPEGPRDLPAR